MGRYSVLPLPAPKHFNLLFRVIFLFESVVLFWYFLCGFVLICLPWVLLVSMDQNILEFLTYFKPFFFKYRLVIFFFLLIRKSDFRLQCFTNSHKNLYYTDIKTKWKLEHRQFSEVDKLKLFIGSKFVKVMFRDLERVSRKEHPFYSYLKYFKWHINIGIYICTFDIFARKVWCVYCSK